MNQIAVVLLSLLVLFAAKSFAAKTYITLDNVDVYEAPHGEIIERWPDKTLFTSVTEDSVWVEVSGHFPEGVWQPLTPHLYIKQTEKLQPRAVVANNSPPMIIHRALGKRKSTAKAYKLLEPGYWYPTRELALDAALKNNIDTDLMKVTDESQAGTGTEHAKQVSTQVAGEPLASGTVITTNQEDKHTLKITGHFPGESWQPTTEPMWLAKPVRMQNRTQPKMFQRPDDVTRVAVIDKSSFLVTVYEVDEAQSVKLVTAPVALGYDRCLSQAKGGKCYYTPEGEFEIEFKLFDPDGINWCVPKKMEAEFKQKLARGERCWRGIMGQHALHFGNSLFLHGTSNPNSIGSRTTHGCVRLRNSDIEVIFRLMQNGDLVLISETPEQLDLIAINNKRKSERALTLQTPSTTMGAAPALPSVTVTSEVLPLQRTPKSSEEQGTGSKNNEKEARESNTVLELEPAAAEATTVTAEPDPDSDIED